MKMSVAEIISGGLFLGFAGWFLNQTLKFPAPLNPFDVGSAAFPKLITITILFLSIILIIQGIRGYNTNLHKIIIKRQYRVIISIVTLVIYVILMPVLGYYISTFIFMILMLILAGEWKVKNVVLITIGFLLFSKLGFEILLNVPLP
ncbi:MAG: tripartite tricarboxylate transporter TctB family protein [Dehalobacterium sp.]